jgi:hypothetical protein
VNFPELAVTDQVSRRDAVDCACIYCGEPLPFTTKGVQARQVGDKFVCNEFCADAIASRKKSGTETERNDAVLNWVYPTD